MELPPSLRFADASRVLSGTALRLGLSAPTFRSPPRMAGATRTIRRLSPSAAPSPSSAIGPGASGELRSSVVAVSLRGRAFAEVLADMIEGVIVANHLETVDAQRVRAELFRAATDILDVAAA